MRSLALLVLVAATVALVSGAVAQARPQVRRAARLIDCRCYDIFQIARTGTGPRLRSLGGSRDLLDVSADRTRLLYEHREGVLSSSTVTARGARVLPTQGGWVDNASFSPDGTKIVYETRSADSTCAHDAIYVMDAAGGDDHTILAGCGSFVASWSPDSRQLAFGRYRTADERSGELVVGGADGSNLRVLAAHAPGIADLQWSPSGDRIAYVAGYRPRMVHVIRTDGSRDLAVSRGRAPTWAPDGRTLEYLWEPGFGRSDRVGVIGRDGTHNHVLDPAAVDPYGQGVGWSPDGRTIAYRIEDANQGCSCMDIYLARPDGSHRRRLVRGIRHEEFGPLYWTADGSRLIYTRYIQHGE
jgi:Tol biopolymer transport system component